MSAANATLEWNPETVVFFDPTRLLNDDFHFRNVYDFFDDVDKLAPAFGFQVVRDNL